MSLAQMKCENLSTEIDSSLDVIFLEKNSIVSNFRLSKCETLFRLVFSCQSRKFIFYNFLDHGAPRLLIISECQCLVDSSFCRH